MIHHREEDKLYDIRLLETYKISILWRKFFPFVKISKQVLSIINIHGMLKTTVYLLEGLILDKSVLRTMHCTNQESYKKEINLEKRAPNLRHQGDES